MAAGRRWHDWQQTAALLSLTWNAWKGKGQAVTTEADWLPADLRDQLE